MLFTYCHYINCWGCFCSYFLLLSLFFFLLSSLVIWWVASVMFGFLSLFFVCVGIYYRFLVCVSMKFIYRNLHIHTCLFSAVHLLCSNTFASPTLLLPLPMFAIFDIIFYIFCVCVYSLAICHGYRWFYYLSVNIPLPLCIADLLHLLPIWLHQWDFLIHNFIFLFVIFSFLVREV